MEIKKDVSLKPYNTFGIESNAAWFARVTSVDDLKKLLRDPSFHALPKLIIGGGSNVLFTGDVPGLVIKNDLKGIEVVDENQDHALVRAMSGEVWHDLVKYCLEKNFAGLENLSLIPGSVGAAPMQNIGAYGVELVEVFEELEALNLETLEIEKFDSSACRFGYRESVFKKELKGKYFITSVTLKLSKTGRFNLTYGAIQDTLKEMGVEEVTIQKVSEAVCRIRQSKLPDPGELGNAGSFFKNPEIEKEFFEKLKKDYPGIPHFPLPDGKIKVPAAWLIEQCGWKGKKIGRTGAHARQALVIVNYGGAQGKDIRELAMKIQKSVKEKFGIELQPEVNII